MLYANKWCRITLWALICSETRIERRRSKISTSTRLAEAIPPPSLKSIRWRNKDSYLNTPVRPKGSVGRIPYFCDKALQIIHKILYFSVILGRVGMWVHARVAVKVKNLHLFVWMGTWRVAFNSTEEVALAYLTLVTLYTVCTIDNMQFCLDVKSTYACFFF